MSIQKPKHYELNIKGQKLETKDILESLVDEIGQSPSVSTWIFNAGKYYFRAFKKHKNPVTDIKKCIQSLVFVLEKILATDLKIQILDENKQNIMQGGKDEIIYPSAKGD